MPLIQQIRKLVADNQLEAAVRLLDQHAPSAGTTGLGRELKDLKSKEIMGIIAGEEARRVRNQLAHRILQLADATGPAPSPLQQQLDRMEQTGKDTNQKVNAIGQGMQFIFRQLEDIQGELFGSRQEQRAFMNKLEEEVERLPAVDQPKPEWYDQQPKTKIKAGLNLLVVKWEREYDITDATWPTSWPEFKRWFIKEK